MSTHHDASPHAVQRVYLTGFMGAGKSTVGALLAAMLEWRFFDLDRVIENQAQLSVAALFEKHGETHFRGLELETLRHVYSSRQAVISMGGGAIETEEVRSLLAADPAGMLVFLEAPLPQLIDRCATQDREAGRGATRPLLRDVPLLQSRYENRLAHYRKAHLTVATQDLTPEEVAARILKHMAAFKNGNNSASPSSDRTRRIETSSTGRANS